MKKNYKKKNRNSQNSQKRAEEWKSSTQGWTEVEMRNEKFENYYKQVGMIEESEWDEFMSCLQTPLPSTFRFSGSKESNNAMRDWMIKTYFPKIKTAKSVDGENVPVPKVIEWYPNELGWQLNCSRSLLRKSPELAAFHKFLIAQTDTGNVSRQEAVSMIPCLFLDVQPSHYVLDMCAAPGSKTAQLIESIHSLQTGTPSGLVIANDADYSRSHTLIHQAKRLNSPCLIVTNHEAQRFPNLYLPGSNTPLKFDRILCDVPCSGDGTMRKNKMLWKNWGIGQANALHKLQVMILERGIQMLKIGGRLVYSTCSFNPVENEAVIAEMLTRANGAVEILDLTSEMPELKASAGLDTWRVMDSEGNFYDDFEQLSAKEKVRLAGSIFPPKNSATLGLEKCMRFYPHKQDTGGFFVAVLSKVSEYKQNPKNQVLGANGQEIEADTADCSLDDEKIITETNGAILENTVATNQIQVNVSHVTETCGKVLQAALVQNEKNQVSPVTEAPEHTLINQSTPAADSTGHTNSTNPTEPTHQTHQTEIHQVNDLKKENGKRIAQDEISAENPTKQLKSDQKFFKKAWEGKKESPFFFLSPDHPELQHILEYFGIKAFPENQFMVRSESSTIKSIYFVSDALALLMSCTNILKLKIVNAGVKLFGRNESGGEAVCPFRLVNEGIHILSRYFCDSICIQPTMQDLIGLLTRDFIWIDECTHKIKERIVNAPLGGLVMRIDPTSAELQEFFKDNLLLTETVYVPVWKGRTSLTILLGKKEKEFMHMRVIGRDIEPVISDTNDTNDVKEVKEVKDLKDEKDVQHLKDVKESV